MENGTKVFYEGSKASASTMNSRAHEYFRAECENGTLVLDNRHLHILRSTGVEPPTSEEIPLLEQETWMNAWLAEMFVRWIAGGPEPPNSLQDNIQCAAL